MTQIIIKTCTCCVKYVVFSFSYNYMYYIYAQAALPTKPEGQEQMAPWFLA